MGKSQPLQKIKISLIPVYIDNTMSKITFILAKYMLLKSKSKYFGMLMAEHLRPD